MTNDDGKPIDVTASGLKDIMPYKAFRLPVEWVDASLESRIDGDRVFFELVVWAASLASPEFHFEREEPEAGNTYVVPRRLYKRLREYLPHSIIEAIEKNWYDGDEDMPRQVAVPYAVTVHRTVEHFRNCPHLNKEEREHVKFLTNNKKGKEARHG